MTLIGGEELLEWRSCWRGGAVGAVGVSDLAGLELFRPNLLRHLRDHNDVAARCKRSEAGHHPFDRLGTTHVRRHGRETVSAFGSARSNRVPGSDHRVGVGHLVPAYSCSRDYPQGVQL